LTIGNPTPPEIDIQHETLNKIIRIFCFPDSRLPIPDLNYLIDIDQVLMFEYKPQLYYPSSEELPDSDETPVDNELQDLIPGMLKTILAWLWADRTDWFFGVDMGIYYDPEEPPIVPDGFLSLGVERVFDEELRLSYPLWEEEVVPTLVLEVVSQTYRGEYTKKKAQYARLGVLYYVVYSSRRRRKLHLEVYKLVNDSYVLQEGNVVWLPELSLGIGIERGIYQGIEREWVYWYDRQGQRWLAPEEIARQEQQQRQEEEQRRQEAEERVRMLEERLRSLGIDPENEG
jgi:Uma2 family endonuclease